MTEPATRTSWETLPEPEARAWFNLPMIFTRQEADKLRLGHIPKAMEDRWFIFHEAGWLIFCRSWTGSCIFGVRLEPTPDAGAQIAECWASRDEEYYSETCIDADRELLHQLLIFLLDWNDAA